MANTFIHQNQTTYFRNNMRTVCTFFFIFFKKKFAFFSGKPQLFDTPSLSNPKRDPCFVYKTRLTTSILRDIDQYVFYVATRGQNGEGTVLGRPLPLIHALFSCQSQTGCWRMGGAASWGALGALGIRLGFEVQSVSPLGSYHAAGT